MVKSQKLMRNLKGRQVLAIKQQAMSRIWLSTFPVDTHTWTRSKMGLQRKNVIQTEKDLKNIFLKILEQTSPSNNLVWVNIVKQEIVME